MKPEWRPNVEEFKKKFDPEKTKGQGVILYVSQPVLSLYCSLDIYIQNVLTYLSNLLSTNLVYNCHYMVPLC
jgi:hypothetical protein